jgi:TonB family protein
VVLNAIISADGTIKSLRIVNGHPMLQQAALDGVRKWTFKPFTVDGEAVEVKTTFAVPFNFNNY